MFGAHGKNAYFHGYLDGRWSSLISVIIGFLVTSFILVQEETIFDEYLRMKEGANREMEKENKRKQKRSVTATLEGFGYSTNPSKQTSPVREGLPRGSLYDSIKNGVDGKIGGGGVIKEKNGFAGGGGGGEGGGEKSRWGDGNLMRRASAPVAPSANSLGRGSPLRWALEARRSLTTETIFEEVNHWQKIRDIVTLKRKLNLGGLEGGRGGEGGREEGDESIDIADDQNAGLENLKAVAEKLEKLNSGGFEPFSRKPSIASIGERINI